MLLKNIQISAIIGTFFLAFQPLGAQISDTMYRFVHEEAQRCAMASVKQDPVLLHRYTHPNVVAAAGGKEVFISLIKDTYKQFEADGVHIDTAYAEMPSSKIVEEQGELRCIIPNKLIISMEKTKIISHSNLLAVSQDKGRTWTFVEADKVTSSAAREAFFPKFKTDLHIPDDRMEMKEE
jgi:hypothetical protein